MFIETKDKPKTRAPEERHVLTDNSNPEYAAPLELRKTLGTPLSVNISSHRDWCSGVPS
jgi:hypothetical protein